MEFIIGYILAKGYMMWEDLHHAVFKKYPRTYDDLMKLPSFAEDKALQERLSKKKDFNREYKKAYYERKSKVG